MNTTRPRPTFIPVTWQDTPWWKPITILFVCVALAICAAIYDLAPHQWKVPEASQLLHVHGTFSNKYFNVKSPYSFTDDHGKPMYFACDPQMPENTCLKGSYEIGLNAIAGRPATVGYFIVPSWAFPSHSNILVTLNVEGGPMISYRENRARLNRFGPVEDRIMKYILGYEIALLSIPAILALLTLKMKIDRLNEEVVSNA